MILIDEIELIARDQKNLRQNLQNARPPIKEIIFFVLGDHQLDLPTDALDEKNFGEIGVANQNPRADALALEAQALTRIFVAEQNRDLDRQKRIKILREMLRCMTHRERHFLLNAIKHRAIPGISRQSVVEAYGSDWLKPRPPQGKTQMPKMAGTKKTDNRPEYEPFAPLKKLGYCQ